MTPNKPSYVLGYWRPWNEKSSMVDSWLNYTKDVSLAKYSADVIGNFIENASKEQVNAINSLGQKIGMGMNILSNQLSEIHSDLRFINVNIELQIEQNKLTNLLLQNISELLRVPDIEKERIHSIELGIKFFINANKDADLYDDALEEFKKAEDLMKQDYFVLHRIGMIYLFCEKHLDINLALDYFLRAAKYASVENDPKAKRLVNILNGGRFQNESSAEINYLSADSYEKAALSSYILGKYDESVLHQKKATKLLDSPENYFKLSKYQARLKLSNESVENLVFSIQKMPSFFYGALHDLDLINDVGVINMLNSKSQTINSNIQEFIDLLIHKISNIDILDKSFVEDLLKNVIDLKNLPYDTKINGLNSTKNKFHDFELMIEGRSIFNNESNNFYTQLCELSDSLNNSLKEFKTHSVKLRSKVDEKIDLNLYKTASYFISIASTWYMSYNYFLTPGNTSTFWRFILGVFCLIPGIIMGLILSWILSIIIEAIEDSKEKSKDKDIYNIGQDKLNLQNNNSDKIKNAFSLIDKSNNLIKKYEKYDFIIDFKNKLDKKIKDFKNLQKEFEIRSLN